LKNISRVHTTNLVLNIFEILGRFELNMSVNYDKGKYKNPIKNFRFLLGLKYEDAKILSLKYQYDYKKKKNYYFGSVDNIIHNINVNVKQNERLYSTINGSIIPEKWRNLIRYNNDSTLHIILSIIITTLYIITGYRFIKNRI